ncbi:MAG: rRNA maturation RNase YbeY [Leucothrix sp.]
MFQLEIQNATERLIPEAVWLTQCANAAYLGEREASAVLRVVNTEDAQNLNRDYREKNYATNILSFPSDFSDLPEGVLDDSEQGYLGDLVVCAEVVAEQAHTQRKTAAQHWAHLVIHGMLHLQGYDHIIESEALAMEAIEIKLLGELGVPNPYNETKEG